MRVSFRFRPNRGLMIWLLPCLAACQSPAQQQLVSPSATTAFASIAYASDRSGRFQVYQQTLTGSPSQSMCPQTSCSQPTWHPDGQTLAMIGQQDNTYSLLQSGKAQPTRLLESSDPLATPQWSPDGLSLAYTAGKPGSEKIYLLKLGGSPRELASGRFPRWSPDGSKILFLQHDRRICQQDLSSDQPRCLTPLGTADFYPRWSPDGTQIVYLTQSGSDWHLALMSFEGQQRRILLPDLSVQTPAWSPDGLQLAFVITGLVDTSSDEAPVRDPVQSLWVMPLANPQARQRLDQQEGLSLPLWTRDGRGLVYQTTRNGISGLSYVPAKGGQTQLLKGTQGSQLLGDLF